MIVQYVAPHNTLWSAPYCTIGGALSVCFPLTPGKRVALARGHSLPHPRRWVPSRARLRMAPRGQKKIPVGKREAHSPLSASRVIKPPGATEVVDYSAFALENCQLLYALCTA